jgi:hypothetical protein
MPSTKFYGRPNRLKRFDRAQAHRLRRAGYTYREIERELGPMSLWTVWYCLRGIPRGVPPPANKLKCSESMARNAAKSVVNKG